MTHHNSVGGVIIVLVILVLLHATYMTARAPIQWDVRMANVSTVATGLRPHDADIAGLTFFMTAGALAVLGVPIAIAVHTLHCSNPKTWGADDMGAVPVLITASALSLATSMFASCFSPYQGLVDLTGFEQNYPSDFPPGSYRGTNNTFNPHSVVKGFGTDGFVITGFIFTLLAVMFTAIHFVFEALGNMGEGHADQTYIYWVMINLALMTIAFGFSHHELFEITAPAQYNVNTKYVDPLHYAAWVGSWAAAGLAITAFAWLLGAALMGGHVGFGAVVSLCMCSFGVGM